MPTVMAVVNAFVKFISLIKSVRPFKINRA
jgi:hypothetical protein